MSKVNDQRSGRFFQNKYQECDISIEDIRKVGNGKCDGGDIDTIDCGFDAGDCLAFNLSYPLCDVIVDAYKVGDGKCNTCRLGKTISVPFFG